MTKTPRTDAEATLSCDFGLRSAFVVHVEFARELEREIERLRRNTGCARNQRSTQFCAEALDAQRDVETLKAELVRNADEFRETLTELRQRVETLTAERDEARREVCNLRPSVCLGAQTASEYAKTRGWDCFKEEP